MVLPSLFISFLPLGKINGNIYSQEVQQGQKGLEAPLHHGGPRDQQGQGYQQVQVHPKAGTDTEASVSKKMRQRISGFRSPSLRTFLQNCNNFPHVLWYHR